MADNGEVDGRMGGSGGGGGGKIILFCLLKLGGSEETRDSRQGVLLCLDE